jgi:hypothetical protein
MLSGICMDLVYLEAKEHQNSVGYCDFEDFPAQVRVAEPLANAPKPHCPSSYRPLINGKFTTARNLELRRYGEIIALSMGVTDLF